MTSPCNTRVRYPVPETPATSLAACTEPRRPGLSASRDPTLTRAEGGRDGRVTLLPRLPLCLRYAPPRHVFEAYNAGRDTAHSPAAGDGEMEAELDRPVSVIRLAAGPFSVGW